MRNFSSDEDLTAMANDVEYLDFEITEEEQVLFTERQREGSLINVALFPNGRSYRARLCLGGKKRILAITKRGVAAAKFADMARLFFWNFRLRNVRPPEDQDFNFSLADAQYSLEHNDVATRLLERMRDHLIRTGELKVTTKQSETERSGLRAEKETRRTVRGELTRFLTENLANAVNTEARLKTLQEVVSTLQRNIAHDYAQIKQAFHFIVEAVHRIEQRQTKDEQPPRIYWDGTGDIPEGKYQEDITDEAGALKPGRYVISGTGALKQLTPEEAADRDAVFGSHLNDAGIAGAHGPEDTAMNEAIRFNAAGLPTDPDKFFSPSINVPEDHE